MGGNRGVTEWVRENASKYVSRPQCIRDGAAVTSSTPKVVGEAIKRVYPKRVFKEESCRGRPKKSAVPVTATPGLKTLAPQPGCDIDVSDLRKQHNPLSRLREACKSLKVYSRKKLFMDRAFCDRFVHIPFARFKQAVYDNGSHTEFDKFHGRAGGSVYWAHPDTIAQCKSEGWMR